ncbi:MAG: hypothetical protein COA99_06785 [Moraxellaceae bacterium]|nr:MAG: hypothetical protein COA99_06785 [Moraxellaceae bacterium]
MGITIATDQFQAEDYDRFSTKVRQNLHALKMLLEKPEFGIGPASIGAELEFYILDDQLNVSPIGMDLHECINDPQVTVELNRFNLEYNLKQQVFSGSPFLAFENELALAVSRIDAAASPYNAKIVPIGILPTLERKDFGPGMMTNIPRYRIFAKCLRGMRGGPFSINIDGEDALHIDAEDVTLEGANTSHQIHWRVNPGDFADYFNAAQLVTPMMVALGANSPSLFGHHLWDETRITLFKQSIDSRAKSDHKWRHPPRVYFGMGWVREGAWELFSASTALYRPIIPIVGDEDPVAEVIAGRSPKLDELKLHQGTTWPWNRAIYDHTEGGHLRIEMRALPAGPSVVDMSANAAFYIGCCLALKKHINHLISILPFNYAEHNFYRAAKEGIHSSILWPSRSQVELKETPIITVAQYLLPLAKDALLEAQVDEVEVERLFTVIEGRLSEKISGAQWQRQMVKALQKKYSKKESFHLMLEHYIKNQTTGLPVCDWSLIP